MKVLLTGGAGFIGTAAATALWDSGLDVVVFDRADDPRDDIADLDRVRAALTSCAAVVHLAAKVGLGVDLTDLDDYARSNDLGTAVVLRAAAEAGVPRVVFASSMVVYGEGRYSCPAHGEVRPGPRTQGDLAAGRFEPICPRCGAELVPGLVPEDAPFDPRNVYAATKVHGEHLADAWCRESGGSVAALRFHNVYGPGLPLHTPYAGVSALFRSRLAARQRPLVFEDGGQRRDFVHSRDVARAVALAATADLPAGRTPLNIGSGRVCTIGEIATLMSSAVAGPAPEVTGGYRLGDVRHITADSAAAGRVLGWTAEVSLESGLAELAVERPSPIGNPSPGAVPPD